MLASTEFVLFEAIAHHREVLDATGFRVIVEVLAKHSGELPCYASSGTGDSIYRENTAPYDHVRPETRTVRTLEEIVLSDSLPRPDLIKLDTQGSELDILHGAAGLLGGVSMLYLEIPIVAYNEGAPTTTDYLNQLAEWGFMPAALFEDHFAHGVLAQVDIMFLSTAAFRHLHGADNFEKAARLVWGSSRPGR